MADIGILTRLDHDAAIWLAMTIVLGGPAAFATGRALALAWRPFTRALLPVALLAAAVDFLCYALFQVPALPVYRLAARLAEGDAGGAAILLIAYAATLALSLLFALAGWRAARARQTRAQYPFLPRR